jgi:hypothetical protein
MTRNGAALPGALLLLVLLGGLSALGLQSARLRSLAGARALARARALTVAEAGIERAAARWDPLLAGSLGQGAWQGLTPLAPSAGASSHDTLFRLGQSLFLLKAVGEQRAADGHLLARASLARLVRLESPALPDTVAAVVAAGATVTANFGVRGEDAVPAGWDSLCPPASGPRVGMAMAAGAPSLLNCPGGTCLSGSPSSATDSALPAGLFAGLGPAPLPTLIAGADLSVSGLIATGPAFVAGTCDRTSPTNWGDPDNPGSPCGSYFPLVAASGGTEILDGAGQGILVATGDLTLRGSAHFRGAVLAMGNLSLVDSAEVAGVVLVQGSLSVGGEARVLRSSCGIRRAQLGGARPHHPVPRGSWRGP